MKRKPMASYREERYESIKFGLGLFTVMLLIALVDNI